MSSLAKTRTIPGRFGAYGGRYVPETLVAALEELESAYNRARRDKKFQRELDYLLKQYAGRPTPLFFARRLSEKFGGARIYLKREDLLHTGAHKINNCLGQALLARRMGKHRIIAETGAGQHGVATATVCALFGFECVVYMGTEDMRRQELNVFRMKLLGAEVRGVDSGSRTLKDAINEAMRDWVTNVRTTHYLLGSVLGAHPYPDDGARFPSRHRPRSAHADSEAPKAGCPRRSSPASAAAPTPSASSTTSSRTSEVKLIGVEAGGRGARWATTPRVSTAASPGVLARDILLRAAGRSRPDRATHSVSAGLDYPGDRPRARLAARSRAAPSTCRHAIRKRSTPACCWRGPKASFPRWSRRTRSPNA